MSQLGSASAAKLTKFVEAYFRECYVYGIETAMAFVPSMAIEHDLDVNVAERVVAKIPKSVLKKIEGRADELFSSYASHYTSRYLVRGQDCHKLTEYL